ncbi:hypothetical protein [uncultured Proteiniphilum sp.]|uniref:hypothetical protein n=1 Tax=uncultured Proteiniphilum sp. TaxID=497637 RepID=UPI002602BADC|nr:hypothetical protein [uncultured Proteiniphilum sp.]
MHTPKRKWSGTAGIAGETKPSKLSLALIRQFAECFHVERQLQIPDNTFGIN